MATARGALAAAEGTGDAFATAHALTDLWLINSIRRDHVAALDHIDRALSTLGDDAVHADLRSFALDCPHLHAAESRQVAAGRTGPAAGPRVRPADRPPDRGTWVTAAVLRYWLGQWDDALAELGPDAAEAPALGLRLPA